MTRLPVTIFFATFIVYAVSPVKVQSDSIWSIPTVVSLIDQGNADLDEFRPTTQTHPHGIVESHGHDYNGFPLGPSLAALPLLALFDGLVRVTAPLTPSIPGLQVASVRWRTRFHAGGGAVLIIDYGYWGPAALDTLQALRHHAVADPFAHPGESDLTCHVDFAALAAAAPRLRIDSPVAQGVWLARLGIEARAAQLRDRATPADAAKVAAALVRLTAPAQMGNLFKAMAISAPGWPQPAGFAA